MTAATAKDFLKTQKNNKGNTLHSVTNKNNTWSVDGWLVVSRWMVGGRYVVSRWMVGGQ